MKYTINGKEYDDRDAWDWEHHIQPYLNSLSKEEKPKEQAIQITDDSWYAPISTEFINHKDINYKMLAILTLISNRNPNDEELHRFIYMKGENSIWSNKELIEKMTKSQWRTIRRNINKLVESSHGIVTAQYNEQGEVVYYLINPYVKGSDSRSKTSQGMYVTINSKILKFLCDVCNSNAIKTYCTLAWLCRDGKEHKVTRAWLAKEIGLSTDCKNNLDAISNILRAFDGCKLIHLRKVWEQNKTNGNTENHLYVRLMSVHEFESQNKK